MHINEHLLKLASQGTLLNPRRKHLEHKLANVPQVLGISLLQSRLVRKRFAAKIGERGNDQSPDMVGIGDSESQMRSKLSKPARKETQAGVTAYQYCSTGKLIDTIHTFFVLGGKVELLKNSDYSHTGTGSCLKRLRPAVWRDWDSGR